MTKQSRRKLSAEFNTKVSLEAMNKKPNESYQESICQKAA